jgi:transposase
MALDSYLSLLDTLEQEIKEASKKIESIVKEDAHAKLLMTIPGVGYHSALLIKSEIGDIRRFPSAKQLSAYAGIIPSTYSSGNITFHGHITKQGSSWLRWIMAEVILHCTRKPGHLQQFYLKLKLRKGEKIARVAAERKLMEWIYHMLKGQKTYEEVEKIAESWGKSVYVSGLK